MLGAAGASAEGSLEVEAGAAFTGYNDARIPSDSGSPISLAADTPPDPAFAFRVRGGYTFAGRHSLMVLAAPLTKRGSGVLDHAVSYQGRTFEAGTELSSSYRFDSYRITYRYSFIKNEGLELAAGATAKLRSADIALMSAAGYAHRGDLGVVPLLSAKLAWDFARPFGLLVDADALWSPFGRPAVLPARRPNTYTRPKASAPPRCPSPGSRARRSGSSGLRWSRRGVRGTS